MSLALGCAPPGGSGGGFDTLRQRGLGSLETGQTCRANRVSTKPDLFGWDPGSRGEVAVLARQGLVVMRYEQKGCDVMLTVLSNCTSKVAQYAYSPYAETQTRSADDEATLFAQFPLAAAKLRARVGSGKGVRADYRLAGIEQVPAGTIVKQSDLTGECTGATHFVRAIHRGAFVMASGSVIDISADGSLFGGSLREKMRVTDSAGMPARCEATDGKLTEGCDVPTRLDLSAVVGGAPAAPVAGGAGTQPAAVKDESDPSLRTAKDLENAAADLRKRRQAQAVAFERVKKVTNDPDVSTDSKLTLLDEFIAQVPEDDSPLKREAVELRDKLVFGSVVTDPQYIAGGLTFPIGARLEALRFRWPTFQLSTLAGSVRSPRLFAGEVAEQGKGGAGWGGVAGLGLKHHVDEAKRFEVGAIGYPLSFSYAFDPDDEYQYSYGFLVTNLYGAVNWGAARLELGLDTPLIWHRSNNSDGQLFGGLPPLALHLSFGY